MSISADEIHFERTSQNDYDKFCSLFSDPLVTRMNGRTVDIDLLFERYLKNIYSFSVIYKNDFAGLCSLFPTSLSSSFKTTNALELVYSVSPNYWNKGIATSSVRKICDFAFERIGLDCVFAGCFVDNIPSSRVLQNNGFKMIFSRIETFSGEKRTESIYIKIGL